MALQADAHSLKALVRISRRASGGVMQKKHRRQAQVVCGFLQADGYRSRKVQIDQQVFFIILCHGQFGDGLTLSVQDDELLFILHKCLCETCKIIIAISTYPERSLPVSRKMMRLLCLWVHGPMNVIIPPHPTPNHPTPPHRSLILKDHCLCLQDSKKDDEVAVPVGAREHERYYPTPPHPTPPHPTPPHPPHHT